MEQINNILSNILKIDVNLINWTSDCSVSININKNIINLNYLYNNICKWYIVVIGNKFKITYTPEKYINISYFYYGTGIDKIIYFDELYYISCKNKVYESNWYFIQNKKSHRSIIIEKYYDLNTNIFFKKIIDIEDCPYKKRYYYLYINYYLIYIYNHYIIYEDYILNNKYIYNMKFILYMI